tara:strand:+ start:1230 stop:2873 length:1644 start_codon:yes stop_codon:yes gene_type:complete
MILNRLSLFLFVLLFISKGFSQSNNFFYGSFESNGVYYEDSESTDYYKKFASNSYLNIKYNLNNKWVFDLQTESYIPKQLQNYSDLLEDTFISTFSIDYNTTNFNFTLGTLYEQFGSGILLRTWEDRELGINNSLWGIRSSYNKDNLSFVLLGGYQKKANTISEGKVFGFDSEFIAYDDKNSFRNLILGLSYLGRIEAPHYISYPFEDLTNSFSGRIDYNSNNFYMNYEYAYKTKDGVVKFNTVSETFVKNGNAHLINIGLIKDGLGLDFTFRRLENMGFYSERVELGSPYFETTLNYLPALTKQHDYLLTNINVYQSQPNISFQDPSLMKAGEIGFQLDAYYNIKKETFLGGKYGTKISLNISKWNNLKGNYDYDNEDYDLDLLGFGEKYFSEQSLEIRKKWTNSFSNIILFVNRYYNKRFVEEKVGEINSKILVFDNTLKLSGEKSTRFEIQHLFTEDDKKNWFGYGIEYNFNYNFSAYFNSIINYENEIESNPTYSNIGVSYSKNASKLMVSYGKQRGGLMCYGGVCRYVPEFKGLSFSIITSF